ncbi:MAG: hypothetical protein WAM85_04370 [Terracidiphilus sp.]
MEHEPTDNFERELRQAFERRPAPPSLKRKLMEKRQFRRTQRSHSQVVFWQRLAASLVLTAVIGGGLVWRHTQDERKGEAARQEVLKALRITNHALNEMNERLNTRGRPNQE